MYAMSICNTVYKDSYHAVFILEQLEVKFPAKILTV